MFNQDVQLKRIVTSASAFRTWLTHAFLWFSIDSEEVVSSAEMNQSSFDRISAFDLHGNTLSSVQWTSEHAAQFLLVMALRANMKLLASMSMSTPFTFSIQNEFNTGCVYISLQQPCNELVRGTK